MQTALDQTLHSHGPAPEPIPMWGRDAELEELLRWYERARNQQHSLVAVSAPSGGGKTRLLDAFVQQLEGRQGVVLRLQGRAHVGQEPLESLEPLVELLRAHPVLRAQACEQVGPYKDSLCASHPAFLDLFSLEDAPQGPHRRVDEVWAQLIHSLGRRGAPLILVVDDAQWLDSMSAAVLRRWRQELPMEGSAVMVLLGMRPEGLRTLPGLRREDFHGWVDLQALSQAACAESYRSMLGRAPTPEVARRLHLSSEGNGFLLITLLRGLQELALAQGRRLEGPSQEQALAWLSVEGQTGDQLLRLLEGVESDARALLSFGSLLGRRFSLALACDLAHVPRRVGRRLLEDLQRRHILSCEEDCARFSHDRFREAIRGALPEARRRDMHARVAELLQQSQREEPFALAYHFHEAGQPQRAYDCAMEAARRARRQEAWGLLVSNLEIALASTDPQDHQRRWPILREMAQGCTFLGRYPEALALLEQGQPQARLEEAQRGGLRAEILFRYNDCPGSKQAALASLELMGIREPSAWPSLALSITWHLLLRVALVLSARWRPEPEQMPEPISLETQVRFCLTQNHGMMIEYPRVIWCLLSTLNRIDGFSPNKSTVKFKSNLTIMLALAAWHGRSTALASQILQDAAQSQDVEAQGIAHTVAALAQAGAGQLTQAHASACRGVWFMERLEDHWEMNLSLYGRGLLELRLGHLLDAMRTGLRLFQRALEGGEQNMLSGALALMHLGSQRQLPCTHPAMMQISPQAQIDEHLKGVIARNHLLESLRTHQWAQAWDWAQVAHTSARRSRLLYLADGVELYVEAARRAWEVCDPESALCRKRRRANWRAALRSLERWARAFPLHRACAYRERALWYGHHDNERQALEFIERSLHAARQDAMLGEEAFSLRARGWLAERFGWAGISADRRRAQALIEQLAPSQQQLQQIRALVWGQEPE